MFGKILTLAELTSLVRVGIALHLKKREKSFDWIPFELHLLKWTTALKWCKRFIKTLLHCFLGAGIHGRVMICHYSFLMSRNMFSTRRNTKNGPSFICSTLICFSWFFHQVVSCSIDCTLLSRKNWISQHINANCWYKNEQLNENMKYWIYQWTTEYVKIPIQSKPCRIPIYFN